MNIKEIELQSGMARSNVRFYEQQGLLSPARQSNGYRDYSEEDLRQLHRIHLLRTLGLSLEEIRALQKGETELETVLSRHAQTLQQQAAEAQQRARLCRQICTDGISYATLDGRHWLDAMAADDRDVPSAVPAVPAGDTYIKVCAPWRRFFARWIDQMFYSTVWIILGLLLVHKSPSTATGSAWTSFGTIVSVIMMVLIEPLLLSKLATTPGKWLLGLSVHNNTGGKLTYGEGFYRTTLALWHGIGFHLPIFSLFRGYKCYYDCVEGKTLEWEYDSDLTLKDEKNWRIAACTGAVIAMMALVVFSLKLSTLPPNRGEITVAEFAENYNRLARYYEIGSWLDDEGRWTERTPDGGYVINMHDIDAPHFVYTEKGGVMTGLSFTLNITGDTESWIPLFENRRILAAQAFIRGRTSPFDSSELDALVQALSEDPVTSFTRTVDGVRVSWQLSAEGYWPEPMMGMMIPEEELSPNTGKPPHLSMSFTMENVS